MTMSRSDPDPFSQFKFIILLLSTSLPFYLKRLCNVVIHYFSSIFAIFF